ncbi:MAG TPA: tRNA (adenosine(37)-N6)-threonylcarbamoyltransferase complex dimerization subunit type 1 TsaB [Verrucomicrobiae bacterium]
MKILALEFSANERSVAIAHSDGANLQVLRIARESSRDVTGLALIDRALSEADVASAALTHLVVGLGPGSYTGIRSAIALAQGWQLGRSVQTVGISSMLCLAATAHAEGMRGELSFIVDAQRGDVYHQKFRLTEQRFEQASELEIVAARELANAEKLVGPEASKMASGGKDLNPTAGELVRLIERGIPCPAEELEPIYLRAASFVKAPPSRQIV